MLELLARYRKFSTLALVVLAGVALLTAQQSRPGDALWLAEGVATVTAPVQLVFARAHRRAAALWTGYLDWKHLRSELGRLRAETVRVDAPGGTRAVNVKPELVSGCRCGAAISGRVRATSAVRRRRRSSPMRFMGRSKIA